MLGLGSTLIHSSHLEDSSFTPESISNISLWLACNTNITADQDAGGTTVSHSTTAGNMAQADRINAWNAAGSTNINAVQTTSADKPRWETSTGNLGGLRSASQNKHMDLSGSIKFNANQDFTILMRFRPDDVSNARAFMGDTSSEFIRNQDADTIRIKTDGTTSDFDSGTALEDEKTITMIIVRSDGATGNINIFMRSAESGYFDGTAAGTAFGSTAQDAEEIIISNIMAANDNAQEFDGNVYDVIIYGGTAVTAAQREQLFDYIEGQDFPQ